MITIIDTKIGNFKSIQNMLNRIGVPSILSNDAMEIKKARKIILPGIGSFDQGITALKKHGLINVLQDKSECLQTTILGICLGMQLLAESSEEGVLSGLGIFSGKVERLDKKNGIKIPHMGWNYASPIKSSNLFKNFATTPRFYFTHSYWLNCTEKKDILSETMYGSIITSSVCRDNRIFGVQFHPEKSHRFGMQLLQNFTQC
jgi:imidazole glycerol-phosphate synthase subunit HisH